MGLWYDKCMRNTLQLQVKFMSLFEIKVIKLTCLIAVLWSHDWVQPMSCSQMGLIQILAHAGIHNCHGKRCRWGMFFYYSFNCYQILLCRNNKSWSNFIWAFIYVLFVDNTGLFTIGLLYCFRKGKNKVSVFTHKYVRVQGVAVIVVWSKQSCWQKVHLYVIKHNNNYYY